jgi:hypothetical protein
MTNKPRPLPKGQTQTTVKPEQPEVNKQPEGAPKNISIQEILNTYPIDREKCRDVLLVEMSQSLVRIANSLEGISQGLIVANTHLSAMNSKSK